NTGRRSPRLYWLPRAPLKSGSVLMSPRCRNDTWLESMPPSMACSQLHSWNRFDVNDCPAGTVANSYSGSGGCDSGGPMYVHSTPPRSMSGYDVSLTFFAKADSSGSFG